MVSDAYNVITLDRKTILVYHLFIVIKLVFDYPSFQSLIDINLKGCDLSMNYKAKVPSSWLISYTYQITKAIRVYTGVQKLLFFPLWCAIFINVQPQYTFRLSAVPGVWREDIQGKHYFQIAPWHCTCCDCRRYITGLTPLQTKSPLWQSYYTYIGKSSVPAPPSPIVIMTPMFLGISQ